MIQSFGQLIRGLVGKVGAYIHEGDLPAAINALRKAGMLPPLEDPPAGPPSCGDRGCGYRNYVGPCGNSELAPILAEPKT